MNKEQLIKTFINGPLQKYLTGDISFGKMIELINEECGTNFKYSDLYPSYLFNATLEHTPVDLNTIRDRVETDFDKKIKKCPLCSTGELQSTYVYLENQTLKAYGCNKCSYSFWEPQIDTKTYTISTSGTTSDFDKKMKECHQYGLCIGLKEKPEDFISVCHICPLKKEKE